MAVYNTKTDVSNLGNIEYVHLSFPRLLVYS